jgi:hypothetical protein
MAGDPGGEQAKETGFLGQGGNPGGKEQTVGVGDPGRQIRVREDAGPEDGWSGIFPQDVGQRLGDR